MGWGSQEQAGWRGYEGSKGPDFNERASGTFFQRGARKKHGDSLWGDEHMRVTAPRNGGQLRPPRC